jgi:glycosyltransferase involved in cell wall biosynthesis
MTSEPTVLAIDGRRPKVTAVLLSYNHAHTIGRALDSILAQTKPFDAILVSDDLSTDSSVDVISKYIDKNERVKLIQPPQNLGMSGNANFSVANIDTEYFAILHHDDVYMPDANRQWTQVLDRYPDVGYVYNAHYDANGVRSFVDPFPDGRVDGNAFLSTYLLPQWACPVWGSAFIRKSAWDAVGGMKTEYGSIADVYLWMELASHFAVGYVPEPLFQIMHDRPESYPEDYLAFTWSRHSALVRIHGDFRRHMMVQDRLSPASLFWFRLRATLLTTKWLGYAVYKRKWKMLRSFKTYRSEYELFGLRSVPRIMVKLGL